MRVKVEGFNCEYPDHFVDNNAVLEFPEPEEIQYFEGAEESIEGELAAFGVRFKWYRVSVERWDE